MEPAHKYHKREDESVERRRVVVAVGAHLRQITCKIYVCTIAYMRHKPAARTRTPSVSVLCVCVYVCAIHRTNGMQYA